MRPPLPGEPIHPERAMHTVTTFRNKRQVRLSAPASWSIRFGDAVYTLRYDGERWSYQRGEETPDLTVETTPEEWINFLLADREGRRRLAPSLRLSGPPEQIAEF